jgi:hypothetical protein
MSSSFFILASTIQFAEFNVLNSVKILQKKRKRKKICNAFPFMEAL